MELIEDTTGWHDNTCLLYTSDTGDIGPTGPIAISSTEGLFFTNFLETNTSGEMLLQDSWLVPNESEYFSLLNETDIKVQPGIYEISFSGFIEKADDSHGATDVYKRQVYSRFLFIRLCNQQK